MKLNPDRSIALVLVQILFRLKGYRKFGFNKQDSLDMIKFDLMNKITLPPIDRMALHPMCKSLYVPVFIKDLK